MKPKINTEDWNGFWKFHSYLNTKYSSVALLKSKNLDMLWYMGGQYHFCNSAVQREWSITL